MTDEPVEATLGRLLRLRVLEPDPARADRIRTRCRDIVARRQPRTERGTRPDRFTGAVLQPALVAGLCLCYLLAVVYDVIRLHGHH